MSDDHPLVKLSQAVPTATTVPTIPEAVDAVQVALVAAIEQVRLAAANPLPPPQETEAALAALVTALERVGRFAGPEAHRLRRLAAWALTHGTAGEESIPGELREGVGLLPWTDPVPEETEASGILERVERDLASVEERTNRLMYRYGL